VLNSTTTDDRPVANPGLPPVESLPVGPGGVSHNLGGYWTVAIDPGNLEAEIVPIRSGMFHFNVTKFIDGPPLSLGISINKTDSDPVNGLIDCMVTLTNPFEASATTLCGFDVRGILFTEGGESIGSLNLAAEGETRLLNADGHTRWWNPPEFTAVGLLGFTPGAAAPYDYSMLTATLNPYKYFGDALTEDDPVNEAASAMLMPENTRGIFKAGESNTRRYRIQFPSDGSGFDLIFNYGVDISWVAPTAKPPVDLPGDFPIEANSPEPFLVEVDETVNTLWYTDNSNRGGELFLNIRVYDWQGIDEADIAGEVMEIRATCPGVFADTILGEFRWEEESNTVYAEYVIDVGDYALPNGAGTYDLLISVVSTAGSYDQGFPVPFPNGPVTSYRVIPIDVATSPQMPFELPYADDMGPNTYYLWSVENGPGHSPPLNTEWAYYTDHWGTSPSVTNTFESDMDTYLVSPGMVVPDSGDVTVRYSRVMQAEINPGNAGGQVMYRINSGSWLPVGGFFSQAYVLDGSDIVPGTGQNPSLTGLTPGDTIEIGFHFLSETGVPSGCGYHIYRIVVQGYEALGVEKIDFPQFLSNNGLSYAYMLSISNLTLLPMHVYWWGVDWSTEDQFFGENGSGVYSVDFPAEGKYWVAANAYLRTPVEWLATGVSADVDVYSFTPTPGAFFTDEFVDNSNGWDLTTGADGNGNFMQVRDDGTGWLDNRQGESGCYGEVADGTPTALAEKAATASVAIPGAIGDGAKTFVRLYHRFYFNPQDTALIRINGIEGQTGIGEHYQAYDPYLLNYFWGWFDSVQAPNIEALESIMCIGDEFNGTTIDLSLVSAPKNDYSNCFSDSYSFGWQVDYIEMYQETNATQFFLEDFNRGFTFSEAWTYPYDLTEGSDGDGNFWNMVPDVEEGYMTNVQTSTGCWNGTTAPAVSTKSAKLYLFIPHTLDTITITVRHRFNVEGEGEQMGVYLNTVQLTPDGGFIYNGLGNYWTGTSGDWVESRFTLPAHGYPGDTEMLEFRSLAMDENDNCVGSGYAGWQIDWVSFEG